MHDDNVRYLIKLNNKLKSELEGEAAEMQLSLAAYIRLILINRGKVTIGVASGEHDKNNEV